MSKRGTSGEARRSDEQVLQMLKRYVHDQRASAAIVADPSRPLQQRLSPDRA
jgi:hypothetical protein